MKLKNRIPEGFMTNVAAPALLSAGGSRPQPSDLTGEWSVETDFAWLCSAGGDAT